MSPSIYGNCMRFIAKGCKGVFGIHVILESLLCFKHVQIVPKPSIPADPKHLLKYLKSISDHKHPRLLGFLKRSEGREQRVKSPSLRLGGKALATPGGPQWGLSRRNPLLPQSRCPLGFKTHGRPPWAPIAAVTCVKDELE